MDEWLYEAIETVVAFNVSDLSRIFHPQQAVHYSYLFLSALHLSPPIKEPKQGIFGELMMDLLWISSRFLGIRFPTRGFCKPLPGNQNLTSYSCRTFHLRKALLSSYPSKAIFKSGGCYDMVLVLT